MNPIAASKHVRFSEPMSIAFSENDSSRNAIDRKGWVNSDSVVSTARNVTEALSAQTITPVRRTVQVEKADPELKHQDTWLRKSMTVAGIIIMIPGTIEALVSMVFIGPAALGLAFGAAIIGSALCFWGNKKDNNNNEVAV